MSDGGAESVPLLILVLGGFGDTILMKDGGKKRGTRFFLLLLLLLYWSNKSGREEGREKREGGRGKENPVCFTGSRGKRKHKKGGRGLEEDGKGQRKETEILPPIELCLLGAKIRGGCFSRLLANRINTTKLALQLSQKLALKDRSPEPGSQA